MFDARIPGDIERVTAICERHGVPFSFPLATLLERGRIVGELDSWADEVRDEQRGNFTYQRDGEWFCAVKSGGYGHCGQYRGNDPDTARADALRAIEARKVF
jgi:hypothetical protein